MFRPLLLAVSLCIPGSLVLGRWGSSGLCSPSAGSVESTSAVIAFKLNPPDGTVWIDGKHHDSRFTVQGLQPGARYTYKGEIRWPDGTRKAFEIDFKASPRPWEIYISQPGSTEKKSEEPELNFGIGEEWLHDQDRPDRITVDGEEVSKDDAERIIANDGQLEDDSNKLRLTVIGSDAERKPVLTDVEHASALGFAKGKLLVQGYAPDNWAVARYGFVCTGKPTIYLQKPDGTVLHRQDEYRGPEALAETIRQANANYDPQKDPDLNRLIDPLASLKEHWLTIVLVGGIGLFLLLAVRTPKASK